MRIALVSEHADPLAVIGGVDAGGQNVYVGALACALAGRGHEVVVHTRRTSPGQPQRVAMAPGVQVEYVTAGPALPLSKDDLPPYMPQFARELERRWRRLRPDVVHAHFWMSGQAALHAARGVPVVQTFHALGTVKRRWQGSADTSPEHRQATEREVGRTADAVVATCTDEVAELRAMGVPGRRLSIVPCGVDLDLFRPSERERPVPGRILSIGRLVPRKGVDTIVRALRDVPGATLLVAGGTTDDPEAVRLRELARGYGLDDRVEVMGSVPRHLVPTLMRSAQAVVSVPWYEPFGIVSVEAMACGVPVVASAVGGHLDTVAGCGLLVPPRRPKALARALRRVLDDADLAAALGHAGAQRAAERFGWASVAERMEQVYEQVVHGRLTPLMAYGP
ncbi:glycosyltransferase [Nonomuraea sp. NPDC050663]|uniref:glycosyltransferase n=1 Tax=Nonomuraea sp. NPDC050663 TaxID=3364370 RepID=UPI0037B570D1